jgi:hypothetical protein
VTWVFAADPYSDRQTYVKYMDPRDDTLPNLDLYFDGRTCRGASSSPGPIARLLAVIELGRCAEQHLVTRPVRMRKLVPGHRTATWYRRGGERELALGRQNRCVERDLGTPMRKTRSRQPTVQNSNSGAAACRTRPWPPRRAELRPASWFGSLTHQPSSPDCSIIGSLPKVALGVLPAAFLEAGRAGIRDELQLHWAVCTNRLCGTAISTSIKG